LARVDGKSPVEYLVESRKEFVRRFVFDQLPLTQPSLAALAETWFSEMEQDKG